MNSSNGILVRYIYSACITTRTKDVCILHDPWFTEGIYDGSWFHFPEIKNPLDAIGDVDLIYISHIHPDHYDPKFLKTYFAKFGKKEVIIADHKINHLAHKMRADGIHCTILKEPIHIGDTKITILPHNTGSINDIDSAIAVEYNDGARKHQVVNVNDVIFDDSMIQKMIDYSRGCDILLCGYTGAGPYPQTYFDLNDPKLTEEANKKKLAFFERYKKLTTAVQAKVTIPFAGKYVLGGKLHEMNFFRGVADPVEVLKFDPKAVVLEDAGGEISTVDLKPIGTRTEPYSREQIENRIQEIANVPMDYERLIRTEEIYQLPLKRLLAQSVKKAHERSECTDDYFFVIRLKEIGEMAIINANRTAAEVITFKKISNSQSLPEPRNEIDIDPRYLFGLLTHVYHWNNAEVGSQYNSRRFPNVFHRRAQTFLNYLCV